MLAMAGCDQYSETNDNEQEETTYVPLVHTYASLEFTSLEELVESHRIVREGKAVGSLAEDAKNTIFKKLDKLYVPTAIPEGYHLYEIKVLTVLVRITYLLESNMDTIDEVGNDFIQDQAFTFQFFRQDNMDKPLQRNATEEDLINEDYYFIEPNVLRWFDGLLLQMNMPLQLLEKLPDQQTKIAEMIKYTEVEVVELGG